jgi:hypothetical protein
MESAQTNGLLSESLTLAKTLEPMFYSHLKNAERHNLDTIEISTARAREIGHDLLVLRKKLTAYMQMQTKVQLATDDHLDKMFGIN